MRSTSFTIAALVLLAAVAGCTADMQAQVMAACDLVEQQWGMPQMAADIMTIYNNRLALGKTSSLVRCGEETSFCNNPSFKACKEPQMNPIFLNCPTLCGCCNFGDVDRDLTITPDDISVQVSFILSGVDPSECDFSLLT